MAKKWAGAGLGWPYTAVPIVIAAALAGASVIFLAPHVSPEGHATRLSPGLKLSVPPSLAEFTIAPSTIKALPPRSAQVINQAIPFATDPGPAARPYIFEGSAQDRDRAASCLAAAQLYEAGGDLEGQRAVAQVVLNRLRHPAFPKNVCSVVFQGAERTTGCQFTFTCDGAMRRMPSQSAWKISREIAGEMLAGAVYKPVGYATHYHTDWVVPYWSQTLDKIAAVRSHLFFRWRGGWGRPAAFNWRGHQPEPKIKSLALLSDAHGVTRQLLVSTTPAASALTNPASEPGAKALVLAKGSDLPDGVTLVSRLPEANVFIIEYPDAMEWKSYGDVARALCKAYVECNLMVWTASTKAPTGFPLKSGVFSTMAFNYVQDEKQGSHRMFWNCRRARPPMGGKCMSERADP